MNEPPTLVFVSGPIGVGKSTCVVSLLKKFNMEGIDFVSSDLYYYLYFMNDKGTEKGNYQKAKKLRDYKLQKAVVQRNSLMWESVLDDRKIAMIESYAKQGYRIIGLFVGSGNLDFLIKRVRSRALENWYDVPVEKVKDRYAMMMNVLKRLAFVSKVFLVVNSDLNGFRLVYYQHNGAVVFSDKTCLWVNQYLTKDYYKHTAKTNISGD